MLRLVVTETTLLSKGYTLNDIRNMTEEEVLIRASLISTMEGARARNQK